METGHTDSTRRPIDVLIENLCAQVRDLSALAMSRGDDAASYRCLAQQAIHALYREQQAHVKTRARYERLIVAHRELRRSSDCKDLSSEAAA